MISFVIFSQALQPSMNLNISELVYCRRISVVVHLSASDKLAVDSLVLLLCGLSLILPKREKDCLANCF